MTDNVNETIVSMSEKFSHSTQNFLDIELKYRRHNTYIEQNAILATFVTFLSFSVGIL